ncbi:MAG TPA: tyrosine-type recombinase/integrase, partial [Dehalococcoidales bacterium]|nr:tyrosine-type recombinase/integrase [Dehalococcoidales bacterium]
MKQVKTMEVLKAVLAGKRMSESSKRNYEAVFKSLAKRSEDFPVKSVEVNEWLVSLVGYRDTTVRLWFTILRNACDYMEANYELKNACKAVSAPNVKKRKRRYFKAQDIVAIVRACKTTLEYALVMTLVDSGCRIGCLSKLKGKDVSDGWFIAQEKTGERRYRLDVRVCEGLRIMAAGDDNLVFGLSREALSMRVIRICKRAGLKGEKLGPHTLRHSSASLVAAKTQNVMAVKALLQQDSVQSAMIYIHDVEEAIQKEISPLKLVEEKVREGFDYQVKMLPVHGATDVVAGDVVEPVGEDELVGGMFREIRDGIAIRPLLKSEDLR